MKVPSFLANRGLSRLPLASRVVDWMNRNKTEIMTIYGQKLKVDETDSMNLKRWHFYEKEESDRLQKLIKPGATCIDVGANIGYYSTMLAELVGKKGWVFAYEPHPTNVDLLIRNKWKNDQANLYVRNVACSSIEGWLYLMLSPISSGMHTLQKSMLNRETYRTTERLEVRTVTLDQERSFQYKFHGRMGMVDFMKVDVEGHEIDVLKGAEQLLNYCEPILMVEYAASPLVIPFLEERDYSIEKANDKNLFAFSK